MAKRTVTIPRKTKETDITVKLNIDGSGKTKISTGIGFLDHMLTLLAKHSLFNLTIKATGDLEVDIHHTNEDVGISLGAAFLKALGSKKGIRRFGNAIVPMDEALAKARIVLDISGRPSFYFRVKPKILPTTLEYSLQDTKEFLKAFAFNAKINMHIDLFQGEDTHHIVECIFKALALALKEAASLDKRIKGIPSTKGKI